jgi:protein-disulfide isomerase
MKKSNLSLTLLWRLAPVFLIAAAAPAANTGRQAEVETIIREYLLANPEVVVQAIQKFQTNQRATQEKSALEAIKSKQADLRSDPTSPTVGEADDPATIVEFFDYRCGYCRKASSSILQLASGRKARIVFKELPILGPESVTLARAALAAHKQGLDRYLKFHEAAMASHETPTMEVIERLAGQAGLDVARLKADLASPDIQTALDRNMALAEALGVRATPTFVIGNEKVEGAIDEAALSARIAKLKDGARPRVAAAR